MHFWPYLLAVPFTKAVNVSILCPGLFKAFQLYIYQRLRLIFVEYNGSTLLSQLYYGKGWLNDRARFYADPEL